jgi:hypothetical protein
VSRETFFPEGPFDPSEDESPPDEAPPPQATIEKIKIPVKTNIKNLFIFFLLLIETFILLFHEQYPDSL